MVPAKAIKQCVTGALKNHIPVYACGYVYCHTLQLHPGSYVCDMCTVISCSSFNCTQALTLCGLNVHGSEGVALSSKEHTNLAC